MTLSAATPRPFAVEVPQATLDAIAARVAAFVMPDAPEGGPGGPWAYGASAAYMEALIAHWRGGFDWRKAEAGLNRFPQFKARFLEHCSDFTQAIHVSLAVGCLQFQIVQFEFLEAIFGLFQLFFIVANLLVNELAR